MSASKVYIKVDSQGRITHIDGGYTIGNIPDVSQWILIDEGFGDKYNHCQSCYLKKSLYEEHGVPRYKLIDGEVVERTQAELDADISAIPAQQPTTDERLAAAEEAILGLMMIGGM